MKIAILIVISTLSLACGLGPDMSKDRIPRSPSPTPFVPEKPIAEYMKDGDAAYASGDHAAAIASYKRAFEIEQRDPKLEKKLWYSLITNLGMSYARTGDTKNARLVVAYAVSKEPRNPIFHYILACSFATEGDESSALSRLSKAYELKANLPAGQKIPDPLTDPCFESYADSDTFKKDVAQMKGSK